MANEGDILKGIMQMQKAKKGVDPSTYFTGPVALKKIVESQKGLPSQTLLPAMAKNPAHAYTVAGKVAALSALYGAQIYAQTTPFMKGLPLTNEIGKLESLLRGAVPVAISAVGTGLTQLGIEKLNNKNWKTSGHNAISKSIRDIGGSLLGYGLKGGLKIFKDAVDETWPLNISDEYGFPTKGRETGIGETKKIEALLHKSYPFLKSGYEQLVNILFSFHDGSSVNNGHSKSSIVHIPRHLSISL